MPSLPHCAVGETIDYNKGIIPAVAKVRVTHGDDGKGAHQRCAGDDQICMALHSPVDTRVANRLSCPGYV